jgi:hypothetical protein
MPVQGTVSFLMATILELTQFAVDWEGARFDPGSVALKSVVEPPLLNIKRKVENISNELSG